MGTKDCERPGRTRTTYIFSSQLQKARKVYTNWNIANRIIVPIGYSNGRDAR